MKDTIAELLAQALAHVLATDAAHFDLPQKIDVVRARDPKHGDFASNVALTLAKQAGMPPQDLAQFIVTHLPANNVIQSIDIAGPGFLNFHLKSGVTQSIIKNILEQTDTFGHSDHGTGQKILVEFISANPTGPLHVGHGRHAAYGASLVSLLKAAGYDVSSEYYVNDAGRQMDILAVSLWVRYLNLYEQNIPFPTNAYRGDYVLDIANDFKNQHGDRFVHDKAQVLVDLPSDATDGGDKEAYIDALNQRMRQLLNDDHYQIVMAAALGAILSDIKQDLEEFGVEIDRWFSERSLTQSGTVTQALEILQQNHSVFEKEGALWFRATEYGDEKDRVVQRANGQRTYFASDIAYHLDKSQRGFDVLLNVFGSDHHGYVARVRAGLEAMGERGDSLEVRLMQFVSLYRDGKRVAMSTRGGDFVSLRELRQEVGNDAARFFYIMRSNDQHLDFDLDLAKLHKGENPVFYVQYAHARICRLFTNSILRDTPWYETSGLAHVSLLTTDKEQALIKQISRLPDIVLQAARNRAPQTIVHYLREVTASYHSFYEHNPIYANNVDQDLRDARLCLCKATAQVLRNGLSLVGVSAPQSM